MPDSQLRLMTSDAVEWDSSGASSRAYAPSTTLTEVPATSAALDNTECSIGRPSIRTSCLGEPKREAPPAASTMACSVGSPAPP